MQTHEYNGYNIQTSAQGNLSRIAGLKGGRVPQDLEGLWTTPERAQRAIDGHARKQALLPALKQPAKVKLTPRTEKKTD